MSEIPRPHSELELLPIDTASTSQKYLAKIGDRQFEVSETLYQFMQLIDGNRTIEEIASEFSDATGKECSSADAERIIETYLVRNGLVHGEHGATQHAKQRSYLYVRIPLFAQELLRPITGLLHGLFAPAVMVPALAVIALFHLYLYVFVERPAVMLSSIGGGELLAVFGLLFLSTLFHELGHSSACHHYGARHGPIGIGLYLYLPVFYADVTDVWRLKRTDRAVVDFGGMYFQLLLVPLLYLLYRLTESSVTLYTIYAVNFSIIVSLNPLLRFDGYWLASDLAGVPNLRKRAQETVRFLVRKLLALRSAGTLPEALNIRPAAKYFLYSYALISNLFFAFFIYHVVRFLPELLRTYPGALAEFAATVPAALVSLDLSEFLSQLSALMFPTLVLVMLGMMAYRLAVRLVRFVAASVNQA